MFLLIPAVPQMETRLAWGLPLNRDLFLLRTQARGPASLTPCSEAPAARGSPGR